MSSIYKKGRDGYYYYQTYVYNPETGKKDKRIFHSLGTKDLDVANRKKIRLDKRYSEVLKPKIKNFKLNKNLLWFAIIIIFISMYFSIRQDESPTVVEETIMDNKLPIPVKIDSSKIENNDIAEVKITSTKTKIDCLQIGQNNKKFNSQKKIIRPVQIPPYEVIKIEKMTSKFDQIKIYVVAIDETNIESLKLLCEKLSVEYSTFSNILICLFNDHEVGENFINGKLSNISSMELRQSWLGMYTKNPVEGAYFDDNPARYLGE